MWSILYNFLLKGSACFDRPGYGMSAICLSKLWKTVELLLIQWGKEKQILFEVCMIKNTHTGIALFSSDFMYKNTDKKYI